MPTVTDTVLGALVPLGNLEDQCFESFAEFIKNINKFVGVQIPASITNVVVSAQQPGSDQRDSLWVRQTNAGGFIAIYIFADGKWNQLYPVPNQLFWLFNSDSRLYLQDVPDPTGFILAWEKPGLDVSIQGFLKAQSHFHNGDATLGWWDVFPVYFSEF